MIKGGLMTLVRNNINALETKKFMDEAEYLESKNLLGTSLITSLTSTAPTIRNFH